MSLIDQAYSAEYLGASNYLGRGDYPHLRFPRAPLADNWHARPIKLMPKPKMRRVRVRVGTYRSDWRWCWRAELPGFDAQHRDMEAAYRMLVRKWQEAP